MPFPHDHEWINGKRIKDHLSLSPGFEIQMEQVVGIGISIICGIGILIIAADDSCGIGIFDDPLLVPLTEEFTRNTLKIIK